MTDTAAPTTFKIDGKIYSTAGLDELSLKDVLLFDGQAADLGLGITWRDVEQISQEFADLTSEEADRHPRAVLMVALTVWASRRVAGDDVSLDEAISIPISSIDFGSVPEPARPTQPRKAGAAKGAKTSGNPAKRAASARPAARAATASAKA
jgi:hypothetical protein